MAQRPLKLCKYNGCPHTVRSPERYCTDHAAKPTAEARLFEMRRGNSAERGYDTLWRKCRISFLRRNPFCALCGTDAEEVHHVQPLAEGGARLDFHNLQALCKACHSRITMKEINRTAVGATVVYGPPGCGKTTYVLKHKREHDIIIDLDLLAQALSGNDVYTKPTVVVDIARRVYRDAIRLSVAHAISHVWIVTAAASTSKLNSIKSLAPGCEEVFLDVGPQECLRRIANDPRRKDSWQQWQPIVERWWKQYDGTKATK